MGSTPVSANEGKGTLTASESEFDLSSHMVDLAAPKMGVNLEKRETVIP